MATTPSRRAPSPSIGRETDPLAQALFLAGLAVLLAVYGAGLLRAVGQSLRTSISASAQATAQATTSPYGDALRLGWQGEPHGRLGTFVGVGLITVAVSRRLLRPTGPPPSLPYRSSAASASAAGAPPTGDDPGVDGGRWADRPFGSRVGSGPGRTTSTAGSTPTGFGGGPDPDPREWFVDLLVPGPPKDTHRWRWYLGVVPVWCRVVRNYVTCLVGAAGVGKSYILEDLGLACLFPGGQWWIGRRVKPVRAALYLDFELDAEEWRRRGHPLARGRGFWYPPDGVLRWWHGLLPAWGVFERLQARGYFYLRFVPEEAPLGSVACARAVYDAVRRIKPGLILVDSLTIGAGGVALSDHNAWSRIYSFLESFGVPVVCIDHLGKDQEAGAVGSFMKRARFRSGLEAWPGKGEGKLTIKHSKSNFGPEVGTFTVTVRRCGPPGASTAVDYRVEAADVAGNTWFTQAQAPAPEEKGKPLAAQVVQPAAAVAPVLSTEERARRDVVQWLDSRDDPAAWVPVAALVEAKPGGWGRTVVKDALKAAREAGAVDARRPGLAYEYRSVRGRPATAQASAPTPPAGAPATTPQAQPAPAPLTPLAPPT